MKIKLLALLCAVLTCAQLFGVTSAAHSNNHPTAPCVIGHTAPAVGFWTWPANTVVTVYVREPDFTLADAAAIKIAIENWDAASQNGSNVHFSFQGFTREAKTSRGTLTLIRGDVYDPGSRHMAVLQARSLNDNQLVDYAIVIVDVRVKSAPVLTNITAHEIGHSLGLLDCYECSRNSTAMGLLKSARESNGIEGPTACDSERVEVAYRDLKILVRPAPTGLGISSEGEEPEEDDTAVVKRP